MGCRVQHLLSEDSLLSGNLAEGEFRIPDCIQARGRKKGSITISSSWVYDLDKKMAREADSHGLNAGSFRDFEIEDGQGNGNALATFKDFIEEAVFGIGVVGLISRKTLPGQKESH